MMRKKKIKTLGEKGGFIKITLQTEYELYPGCIKKAGTTLEVTKEKAAEIKAGGFLDKPKPRAKAHGQ